MALLPNSKSRLTSWVENVLYVMRKDLVNELIAASSRCQVGRGCKLNCFSNANSSSPHGEGGL